MMAIGAGSLRCYGSPAVHVAVHGEQGAYVMMTLVSLIREDFIDGASWMLLEWWGQLPGLARVDGTLWGCLCQVL